MQMLLYLVSIWRGGSDFYESITPAGILYFPANLVHCDVGRNESEESKAKKLMAIRLTYGAINTILNKVFKNKMRGSRKKIGGILQ